MKSQLSKQSSRKIFIFWSLISGFSFAVLSFFVNKDVFRNIDYSFMTILQSSIPRNFDLPFSLLTLSGSSEITGILILCIFMYYLISKKRITLSIFLFGAIFVIELMGKLFIYHPIPPPLLNRNVLPIRLPSSFMIHTNFSYPSGHMSRSMFVAILTIFLFIIGQKKDAGNWWKIMVVCVYIFSMIISRIYLGEHWLTDVLGGVLLGSGLAMASLALW